jgi:hypothetical protein
MRREIESQDGGQILSGDTDDRARSPSPRCRVQGRRPLGTLAQHRLRQVEAGGMKRKRQSKGPYVAVPKAIMATPAWRAMSPEGRLLWFELRGWLRNDGLNNGKVLRSCRDAAKSLGFNEDTIARRFAENEHYGFLRKTSEGFLGADGRGIAAKYRFTDLAHGTHPPTRDYEKWDGELFAYIPRRTGRKKQNPVPPRGTPCLTAWDIRKVSGEGSVCPTLWDIHEAARCPTAWDISRLPFPAAGGAQIQGSSTVRAPARAGGAGSSPAPVAKPDLTAMVLDIVAAQLDELDRRREAARIAATAGHTAQREAPAGATISAPQPYRYGSQRPPRIYGCGHKRVAH